MKWPPPPRCESRRRTPVPPPRAFHSISNAQALELCGIRVAPSETRLSCLLEWLSFWQWFAVRGMHGGLHGWLGEGVMRIENGRTSTIRSIARWSRSTFSTTNNS